MVTIGTDTLVGVKKSIWHSVGPDVPTRSGNYIWVYKDGSIELVTWDKDTHSWVGMFGDIEDAAYWTENPTDL